MEPQALVQQLLSCADTVLQSSSVVLRNWIQVGVLGSILATVLAGGYHLHELNRERAVEQFQQLEQHTANEIASLLQIELTGAARTLQAVAQTAPGADAHTLNDLVDRQQRCDEVPCFTAATLYGADGQTMATSRRQVDLAPADVADTLAWAAEPSHALTARTLISSPQPPSLILLPKGCVFRPRCPYHELVPGNRCDVERPELLPVTPDHAVRCHIDPPRRREIAAERFGALTQAPRSTGATTVEDR